MRFERTVYRSLAARFKPHPSRPAGCHSCLPFSAPGSRLPPRSLLLPAAKVATGDPQPRSLLRFARCRRGRHRRPATSPPLERAFSLRRMFARFPARRPFRFAAWLPASLPFCLQTSNKCSSISYAVCRGLSRGKDWKKQICAISTKKRTPASDVRFAVRLCYTSLHR